MSRAVKMRINLFFFIIFLVLGLYVAKIEKRNEKRRYRKENRPTNSKNVVQCVFSSSTSGAVADLTFINKLTNYDYVGHNAIATNIIPKNREITGISLEYPNVVPAEKNSSGYTIQARDLIGHFIYDDGEQSENPLTVQELESLSFPDRQKLSFTQSSES